MRLKLLWICCSLLVVAGLAASAVAQEGHPLTGTWYGDFGQNAKNRNDLTVILNWDGKNVTGLINPGPDMAPIKVAVLDSSKWTVHFEIDIKNKAGGMDHFVFDGKLNNVVAGNRWIGGTWTCGNTKGDFKIQRDV